MNTSAGNSDYITLLGKTARDTGWEIVQITPSGGLIISSAFHNAVAELKPLPGAEGVSFRLSPPELLPLVKELLGAEFFPTPGVLVSELNMVRTILKKASDLARQPQLFDPVSSWEREVKRTLEEDGEPATTERIAEVKQRVGQDQYRSALLNLWNGQCAVTGIDVPEILRASHARPWAECETDRQRLDPYNGFLLSANLDLLFDSGLVTFDDEGRGILSNRIKTDQAVALGLEGKWGLRWVDERHREYLGYHREKVFQKGRDLDYER